MLHLAILVTSILFCLTISNKSLEYHRKVMINTKTPVRRPAEFIVYQVRLGIIFSLAALKISPLLSWTPG